jgi:hypothetical protein
VKVRARPALAPGGAVVVVEHVRDDANVLAHGPWAWHFLTRGAWMRAFRAGGLEVVGERRIGGWVVALVARPVASGGGEQAGS